MTEYRSYNSHLREKYGCKVYKISLSSATTCPNRDGELGKGGCIFCSMGSGDFKGNASDPIEEQMIKAKELVSAKAKSGKYVAYFGSFTSTYGDPEKIKEAFLFAARDESVAEVSVATRPDCLGEEIMEILREVKKIKPLTVELGLQSAKESTAELINRCSRLEAFDDAIERLKNEGIEIVLHIILGLPGETLEDMLESVQYAVDRKVDGIKLQLLHVLEGTELARMYRKGEFEAFEMEEYLDVLERALKIIPKSVVVHRLTGDGAKKSLIAPMWSANKKAVLNEINRRFKPI